MGGRGRGGDRDRGWGWEDMVWRRWRSGVERDEGGMVGLSRSLMRGRSIWYVQVPR